MSDWKLYCADAKVKLKDFPENHFDSCVMDGPYGWSFMGKDWDNFKPEQIKIRTVRHDRKNGKAPDGASGRGVTSPSASPSQIAGKYNQSLEANRNFQNWFYELAVEVYRVLKPGAYFLSFGGPRTAHRMISGIEDAGFEIRDVMSWMFASGFPKSHNLREHGVGTALKPSYEPIVMARKPLDGTVEENFNKWGTGVLHIEKSRVPGEPWKFGTQTDIKGGNYGNNRPSNGNVYSKNVIGGEGGRWPANLLHDGSPEVVALFPDSKGQLADVKGTEPSSTGDDNTVAYGKFKRTAANPKRNDSGSAARFFHSFQHDEEDIDFIKFIFNPKTSRKDRNEGCYHLPDKILDQSNQAQAQAQRGILHKGKSGMNTAKIVKNNHPTVKPTSLMQYLVKLVTPVGGKCIDPCCGSGSTGKACVLERIAFTGIDLEQQWIDIADQRMILAWNKIPKIV